MSAGGVRGVWGRHNLLSRHDRLLRLESIQREAALELSEKQVCLLERFGPGFRERQIEVHHSGERVANALPFFKAQGVRIETLLSDNGREYCGRQHHPFELFMQLEDIAHRTTRVRRPQSNGCLYGRGGVIGFVLRQ